MLNFENWIKSGLFRSLKVDNEVLLKNSQNIFRYLQIKQKIPHANNQNLPFLNLPLTNGEQSKLDNKNIINQKEQESLGLYISYFSR